MNDLNITNMEDSTQIIELLLGQIQRLESTGNILRPWEDSTNSIIRRVWDDPHYSIRDHIVPSFVGETIHEKRQYKELLQGRIEQLKALGNPKRKESSVGSQINISNVININLIVDVLKKELSKSQVDELKTAYSSGKDESEKKRNVIQTLKQFGTDVASNILANILSNPSIFSGL